MDASISHALVDDRWPRPRPSNGQLVVLCALALTVFRSLVPLVEQQLNADEALVGLMAKHLAEGRAFPLFLYSLPHILGITSWIAAPFIALGGTTAAMLKLPLVLINVGIAWLLVDRLQRDARLRPLPALIAALPFVLAPVYFSHYYYLDAAGGNPEPSLFVLLLWILRRRPLLFGVVLGVGVLNRPFAGYGAAALFVVQCWDRSILQSQVWKGWLVAAIAVAAVWDMTFALRLWSSPMGPGTSFDPTRLDTVGLTMGFLCFDPSAILSGFWRFTSDVLPLMFGSSRPLPQLPYVLGLSLIIGGGRFLWCIRQRRDIDANLGFPLYLTILGVLSAVVYVTMRCGVVNEGTMRYAMLTPFASVGALAMLFALEPRTSVRRAVGAIVCVWAAAQFVDHTRLLAGSMTHGPTSPRQPLAKYLEEHGIRYAWADYWDAQVLTYLTGERVVVASENVVRISFHQTVVESHAEEAVRISPRPCPIGGVEAVPGRYWVCPLSPAPDP